MPRSAIEFEPRAHPARPRKDGLRDRIVGDDKWFPSVTATINVIPRSEWEDWVRKQKEDDNHLRNIVWKVLDQDGRGSCAQEQGAGANMLIREFMGGPREWLNPWPSYWRITGGRDQGSSISSAYKYGKEWGWIPMRLCPRSGSYRKQPQRFWDEAQKYRFDEIWEVRGQDEFVSCLLQGFPVGYGRRGHAILAVQYLGNYKFKYANSWGSWTNCNDRGFGIDDIRRDLGGYGMFAARTVLAQST